MIEKPSHFQDRVFFILDLKHFLRRMGSVDGLKKTLTWLPTWYDARYLLQSHGVSDDQVADSLREAQAIERKTELLTLYRCWKQRWGCNAIRNPDQLHTARTFPHPLNGSPDQQ